MSYWNRGPYFLCGALLHGAQPWPYRFDKICSRKADQLIKLVMALAWVHDSSLLAGGMKWNRPNVTIWSNSSHICTTWHKAFKYLGCLISERITVTLQLSTTLCLSKSFTMLMHRLILAMCLANQLFQTFGEVNLQYLNLWLLWRTWVKYQWMTFVSPNSPKFSPARILCY